jgi:large subunit ribosomal protein L25
MDITLRAETGRTLGSRPSRRLRRTGMVPAVVYGRELEATSVAVNARELNAALRTEAGLNAIITLHIDDGQGHTTLAREIQRHPVRGDITHLDFVKISLTETVEANVSVELEGTPEGVREGGIVETINATLLIEALPTDIPTAITVDISHLDIGDTLTVADLPTLPGVEYLVDPETPVAVVALPAAALVAEEAEEAELEEGMEEAAEEGAEAEREPADED